MESRLTKQLFILGIFLGILLVGFAIFSYLTRPPEPTCFDNIQNQNEADVDCGGSCPACATQPENIVVADTIEILIAEGLRADVVFSFRNPNPNFGAVKIPYTIELFDTDGQLVGARSGEAFLAPREERSVIQNAIDVKGRKPETAGIVVGEVEWAEGPLGVSADVRLRVVEQELVYSSVGPEFAYVRGVVRNDSSFEFFRVFVNVLLYSQSGQLLAARATELRNLSPGTRREFRVAWRISLPQVFDVRADAFTNLFAEENFVRQYDIVPYVHRRGVPR